MKVGRVALMLSMAFLLAGPLAPQRAASAAGPAELDPLAFLIGEWPASGTGQPGQGTGSTTFARSLQDKVIVRTNHADYPAQGGKPASRHDDLMVIYAAPGGGGARADYYDSEGHVIRYAVQTPDANQAVFTSDATAGAPRFRLTYKLEGSVLKGTFEIAGPDAPDAFKPYLSWESRKAGAASK
jgi:hypothetical protein